jgi:hypothetical protein
MLLASAARPQALSLSAGFFVDQFSFLSTRGLSLRASLPLSSRIAPFLELGAARFQTRAGFGNIPDQAETSWLLGAGATGHVLDRAPLGLPMSISAYGRLQFGHLKHIELFSGQLLALATLDLRDRWRLLVTLGGGVSYRYTSSDVADAVKPTTNDTNGRGLLSLEWPWRPDLSLVGELAYEEKLSGGIGVRFRP